MCLSVERHLIKNEHYSYCRQKQIPVCVACRIDAPSSRHSLLPPLTPVCRHPQGAVTSHEPGPGVDPSALQGRDESGFWRRIDFSPPACAVDGLHTLDARHVASVKQEIGGPPSPALVVAAAHQGGGEDRVVLVLTKDGRVYVVNGGYEAPGPGGCGGPCGTRTPAELSARNRAHVNQITAINVQPQATTISLGAAAPIEVTLTDAAAGALVAHIQGLQALGRGLPPAGISLQGAAPSTPPTPHSAAVGLLAGMIINHAEGGGHLPAEAMSRLEVVLTALIDKGVLDLADSMLIDHMTAEALKALTPPLLEGMARGAPDIKTVKFAPAAAGAQQLSSLSAVLARAWSLTKLSLKNLGVTAATFDAFVQDSMINGGSSQVAHLNLGGNPGIAGSLGQHFQSWPKVPVLDLSSASPIYSSAGALQKLTLDGSAMSLAQATDVLNGLQFHVASLTGLSLSGAIQPGGSPDEFMQSLGSLLQASKALSVLDLSDCALELDVLPAATKAPLQVLNLGGNSFRKSAANINSLAGSVAKTLQLLSLRGCSVAAGLSLTIGNGLTSLDACIDLSGLQIDGDDIASCVELGASAPQTLVVRDIMPQQVASILTAMSASNVQDLDVQKKSNRSGAKIRSAPIGPVLGTSTLTSLNISRCDLGAHLSKCIQGIAEMSPTLTSLDVSHNGATGLIPALCDKLKGNRSLTALKLCGNNTDFEGVQALRKFFGGVNSQSGVMWGNKSLVALDVPSKGFEEDVKHFLPSCFAFLASLSAHFLCSHFWYAWYHSSHIISLA